MNHDNTIRPNGRMGSKNAGVVTAADGTQILFSYRTPVAMRLPDGTFLSTLDAYHVYSSTTAKHITEWLRSFWDYGKGESDHIPCATELPFQQIKDRANTLLNGITVDFQTNSSVDNPIGNGRRSQGYLYNGN